MEEKGIKEAKELLRGVNKLVLIFLKEFKDGFQMEDIVTIFTKLALDKELRSAISGLDELKGEFQDISWEEGIELGQELLSLVPLIINELKNEKA
jgi:hypothetical protein